MNEELFFYPAATKQILVHSHSPEVFNGHVLLFLNPIFDEKNRAQSFQAQTARALCSKGYQVIRFDYEGTGDSKGSSQHLSGATIQANLASLAQYAREKFPHSALSLLGIRFGADLALDWMAKNDAIHEAHLIEPVFDGSKYIVEQRLRRKLFQKINGIDPGRETIDIDGERYEDFQGYLLSEQMVKFIQGINSHKANLKNRRIFLYKLEHLFSQKSFDEISKKLGPLNAVSVLNLPVESFWEKLETTDTAELTKQVLNTVTHKAYVQ